MKKMNEISRCRPRLELMCLNRQALTVGFEPTYLSARLFSKQPAYDLLHTSALIPKNKTGLGSSNKATGSTSFNAPSRALCNISAHISTHKSRLVSGQVPKPPEGDEPSLVTHMA